MGQVKLCLGQVNFFTIILNHIELCVSFIRIFLRLAIQTGATKSLSTKLHFLADDIQFSTKIMLTYYQLASEHHTSMKFQSKLQKSHQRNTFEINSCLLHDIWGHGFTHFTQDSLIMHQFKCSTLSQARIVTQIFWIIYFGVTTSWICVDFLLCVSGNIPNSWF